MSPGSREGRARVLLVAVSLAFALMAAEISIRVLLRRPGADAVRGTPIAELSPTLGWRTRALGSQRIVREGIDVTVTLNSRGLRGPDLDYEPAAGRRRLVIMGDSFAHGYYADEGDTLRGRLGAALGRCGVDVVNAGGPGYSTDQEWLYFREEIHTYQPREVVLLFYYNDLSFNLERTGTANRSKPLIVEKGGELEVVPPVPASAASEVSAGERPADDRAAPRFRGSALWAFVAGRLARRRPDWSRALAERGLAPALSREPPSEYLPFAPRDARERARVDEMWRRTGAILRAFHDDVRRAGAGFSVFYVPARFEVNDEAWRFVQRRYGSDWNWNRGAVSGRLEQVLKDLDIPLFEATKLYATAERGPRPAYIPSDGHWNANGNRIAFEAIFPVMRRVFDCAP